MRYIIPYLLSAALLLGAAEVLAQGESCDFSLNGQVIDEKTGRPLEFTNIYVEETGTGTITDTLGKFLLEDLCHADFHLRISHVGCHTERIFFHLHGDSTIQITLHHHEELLDELIVVGDIEEKQVEIVKTIKRSELVSQSNKNLSDILENVTGVSILKTGSSISKPVVHGLYGNRVAVINNGLVQSGQQWGNDHAPEIDPFMADKLSVIKGASSLQYGGNALSSVVAVEAKPIAQDPHLHGQVNYIVESNGWGQTLNARLEQYSKWAAWRLMATGKLSGDHRTANHYLTNTGKREYNVGAQLEKRFNDKWKMRAFYSLFHTDIGILRGSHIGNLTDLNNALERDEPFFTEDDFSYGIDEPRQQVNHHLVKMDADWLINESMSLKLRYGFQYNHRNEFDVRRGGRSDMPTLSIQQQTHHIHALYKTTFKNRQVITIGLQYEFQYNSNDNEETGVLPLIPDYTSNSTGLFAIYKRQWDLVQLETGIRYDLIHLKAITISNAIPREIIRYQHLFHNLALSGGVNWRPHEQVRLIFEAGYTERAPEVNELYSNGLHQGVSGIEEGSASLGKERSLKTVFSLEWSIQKKVFLEALGYYQYANSFIYLEPQDELRLTIRGAFPVFAYRQDNARIAGGDILLSVTPVDAFKMITKYALVRGYNMEDEVPLINMPSDRISLDVEFYPRNGTKWKNHTIALQSSYTFEQKRLDPEQDFAPAPEGYFLLGFSASTTRSFQKSDLTFELKGENLLNQSYREYLNRQRYFADDLGVNIQIGINYAF